MKKVLMVGEFNSITENIYRSLLGKFYVQFCPTDEEIFDQMYQLMSPELALVSLVGMKEEGKSVLARMKEKHSKMPVLCVGNPAELSMFESELAEKQFSKLVRPVTIREITEGIYQLLNVPIGGGMLSSAKANRRKRILLVDDSAIQLRTMKGLLQSDYDVDMAISAQEAMTLIYKNTPDLIFLDYDMPQCDGKMTFEMFKNEPISSDIPVVFLTGVTEKGKVLSVLNMYPADYLIKPVDKSRIMETIRNVFEQ